jgi:hypothetical protein
MAASRAAREDWLFRAIQTQLAPEEHDALAAAVELLKRLADSEPLEKSLNMEWIRYVSYFLGGPSRRLEQDRRRGGGKEGSDGADGQRGVGAAVGVKSRMIGNYGTSRLWLARG